MVDCLILWTYLLKFIVVVCTILLTCLLLRTGKDTVHGQLESQGLSADGVPYVTCSDGFTVHKVSEVNRLHL